MPYIAPTRTFEIKNACTNDNNNTQGEGHDHHTGTLLGPKFTIKKVTMAAKDLVRFIHMQLDSHKLVKTYHPEGLNHHFVTRATSDYAGLCRLFANEEMTSNLLDLDLFVFPYIILQPSDARNKDTFPVPDMRGTCADVKLAPTGRMMTKAEYDALLIDLQTPSAPGPLDPQDLKTQCLVTGKDCVNHGRRFGIVEGMHRVSALMQVLLDTKWATADDASYLMRMHFNVNVIIPNDAAALHSDVFPDIKNLSARIMSNKTKIATNNVNDVLTSCMKIIRDSEPKHRYLFEQGFLKSGARAEENPEIYKNLRDLWVLWALEAGHNDEVKASRKRLTYRSKSSETCLLFLTKTSTKIHMDFVLKADASTGTISGTFSKIGMCYKEYSMCRYLSNFLFKNSVHDKMLKVHDRLIKKNLLTFRTIGKFTESIYCQLTYNNTKQLSFIQSAYYCCGLDCSQGNTDQQ